MKTDHIELLAPAGSFAALQAGIKAGCDAVYFGIDDFNMRASASANFKISDLSDIVSHCKKHKIKTYLTLNTVMYDRDLSRMKQIVQEAKKHSVTAIIAADMATIEYAYQNQIEVHLSTQLSISNTAAVRFFSQFADRMVLARELSLTDVAQIVSNIHQQNICGPKGNHIEIEVFTHGALCVAVSGRCGMSLYAANSSANHGKCHHICRRPYKVTDISSGTELVVDNNFVMSSADLCSIGMLDQLLDSGVKSFKFEGRGRTPDYVYTVISTYKQALQAIESNNYNQKNIKKWNTRLQTVFNRGFTQNFYMGKPFDEWSKGPGNKSTHQRHQIGFIEKYYPKIKVAQVKIVTQETIMIDDTYSISGKTTGIVTGSITKLKVDDTSVQSATQGDIITFPVNDKVRKNDQVFVIKKSV